MRAGDNFRFFAVFRVFFCCIPYIVHRHRQAERGHLVRHLRVAGRPAPAQFPQFFGKLWTFRVKTVAQQVKAAVFVFHGQLDARQEVES